MNELSKDSFELKDIAKVNTPEISQIEENKECGE